MKKKILMGFFLSLLAVTFLGAQSLAEISKKEKERRAALKGKQTVVTNEDLAKVKKKAALTESLAGEAALPEGTPEEKSPATGATPPADQAPPELTPEAGKEASLNDQALSQQRAALEDKWNRAQELVDLLTMKMNALWQQFYSLDDMTAKESIQLQIGQTYEKLLKTQEEEVAAREELAAFVAKTPR